MAGRARRPLRFKPGVKVGTPQLAELVAAVRTEEEQISLGGSAKGKGNFSFSGLKTSVVNYVRKNPDVSAADVAASFQATVVKTLVRKSLRAGQRLGIRRLVLTGGVAANTALREALGAFRAALEDDLEFIAGTMRGACRASSENARLCGARQMSFH